MRTRYLKPSLLALGFVLSHTPVWALDNSQTILANPASEAVSTSFKSEMKVPKISFKGATAEVQNQFLQNEIGKPKVNTLKIDIKNKLDGGVHGGGGVSADENGKRKLLDLIERDELEYFLPETVLKKDSEGSYENFSPLYVMMTYYARWAVEFQDLNCKKMPTFPPHPTWGGNAFLLTVSQSYLPGFFDPNMNCDANSAKNQMDFIYQSLKIKPVTQLRWAFTENNLENLNDEGIIHIDNPKSKRQLAIQKGSLVVINKKEFMLLDEESKQALFLHECVLRAVLLLNPQHIEKHGTEYVRAYVRNATKLFNDLSNGTVPYYIVSDAYKMFEIEK